MRTDGLSYLKQLPVQKNKYMKEPFSKRGAPSNTGEWSLRDGAHDGSLPGEDHGEREPRRSQGSPSAETTKAKTAESAGEGTVPLANLHNPEDPSVWRNCLRPGEESASRIRGDTAQNSHIAWSTAFPHQSCARPLRPTPNAPKKKSQNSGIVS